MKKIFMLLSLAAATVSLVGCGSEEEEVNMDVKYLVTSPLKKDTTVTIDYVCQIHAISHIELRALERGYLQDIFVDEGQTVKKGQLMFRIMPLLYQAEAEKSQAELDFAETEYKNAKSLADKGVISANELALVKAKFDKAKAELSLAKVHLSFTEIKAPFDGIMNRFNVRLGSLVDEGDLLSTLSDNREMWVYFNVPEAQYLDYKTDVDSDTILKVQLMMANNKVFDYVGYVRTIEADFNNETGNIAFRATFPNPKGLLRHGETGNILAKTPLKDAILIPQKATFEVLDKKYVYVVDAQNRVRLRQITIGAELNDLYEIKSGVTEKDKILLEGIRKVKNNEKIKFEYKDPKTVISHLKLYAE